MRNDVQIVSRTIGFFLRREGQRTPHLSTGRIFEVRPHHAYDCELHSIEGHGSAYNGWVSAEVVTPNAITQHSDVLLPRCAFLCLERAAQHRLRLKRREVIGRHQKAM